MLAGSRWNSSAACHCQTSHLDFRDYGQTWHHIEWYLKYLSEVWLFEDCCYKESWNLAGRPFSRVLPAGLPWQDVVPALHKVLLLVTWQCRGRGAQLSCQVETLKELQTAREAPDLLLWKMSNAQQDWSHHDPIIMLSAQGPNGWVSFVSYPPCVMRSKEIEHGEVRSQLRPFWPINQLIPQWQWRNGHQQFTTASCDCGRRWSRSWQRLSLEFCGRTVRAQRIFRWPSTGGHAFIAVTAGLCESFAGRLPQKGLPWSRGSQGTLGHSPP